MKLLSNRLLSSLHLIGGKTKVQEGYMSKEMANRQYSSRADAFNLYALPLDPRS